MEPPEKRPPANWFKWGLHTLVGGIIGLFIGWASLFRLRWPRFSLEFPDIWLFPLAFALICGGLYSLIGDRIWGGVSDRPFPGDKIGHSPATFTTSLVMLTGGAAIVILRASEYQS